MSSQPARARGLSGLVRAVAADLAPRPAAPPAQPEVSTILSPTLIRGCREVLQRLAIRDSHRELGVTSSVRKEGRSSIAAGLAVVSALDHERRTVLVDLDLDSPTQHRRFGIGAAMGVSDLSDDIVNIEDYLQPVAKNLWVLAAGRPRGDAPRALHRVSEGSMLSQVREWCDFVVFDLPPLFGSSAGALSARLAAQPVLVVRTGFTQLPQVARAAELFAAPPAVILNDVHSALPRWLLRSVGEWR